MARMAAVGVVLPAVTHLPRRRCRRTASVRPVHSVTEAGSAVTSDLRVPEFGTERTKYDLPGNDYDLKAWASAFENVQDAPEGYWVTNIEGVIPTDLQGTYYRNGPGDVDFLNEPVDFHWDANGIIGSVAFKDGKAFFRSKFVDTDHTMLEKKAGRRLFKGAFGTIPKHGVSLFRTLKSKNTGGGKPILLNDRLYVPFEGAHLTQVDPATLETVYPKPPGGLIAAVLNVIPSVLSFFLLLLRSTEHLECDCLGQLWRWISGPAKEWDPVSGRGYGDPKFDVRSMTAIWHRYRFLPSFKGLSAHLDIEEVGDNLMIKNRETHAVNGINLFHSVGLSDNYIVCCKFPFSMDTTKSLDPKVAPVHCINWDDNGTTEFHVLPRSKAKDGAARVFKMKEASFIYHFINVFEQDDKLIIDAIHYPRFPNYCFGEKFGRYYKTSSKVGEPIPRFRRTVCSLKTGEIESQQPSTRAVELPAINLEYMGRPYKYVYMLTGLHPSEHFEPQAITKVALETGKMEAWTKGPQHFAGEPIFIPREGAVHEDDGYVMSFCYNGATQKTELVILDAQKIENGPITTLYLDHAIPHGFHGSWTSSYYGP